MLFLSILSLFKYLLFYYALKLKMVSGLHSWVPYKVLPKQLHKSLIHLSGRLLFQSLPSCLLSSPPCTTHSNADFDKSTHEIYNCPAHQRFTKRPHIHFLVRENMNVFLYLFLFFVFIYVYNVYIHRHSSYDIFQNPEISETKPNKK